MRYKNKVNVMYEIIEEDRGKEGADIFIKVQNFAGELLQNHWVNDDTNSALHVYTSKSQ